MTIVLFVAIVAAGGVVMALLIGLVLAVVWLVRRSDRSVVNRMHSTDRVDDSGNPDAYTPHSHI